MAKVQRTVITALGEQMLFSSALTYTNATLCSQDVSNLTIDQLRSLTDLTGKVLSSPISAHKRQGNTKADQVDVQVTFTNQDQKADINYSSIGWFARDRQGHETLIAVTPFVGTDTIAAAPPDGAATSSKNITLSMATGTATEINVLIDPAGSVTPSTFNAEVDKINEALALKADNAELADYAKKADVNSALDAKADKTALDPLAKSEDVAKDVETLNSAINLKADKTDLAPLAKTEDVNTELDKKADKATVNSDIKTINDTMATKADKTTVDGDVKTLQASIDTKADKTALDDYAKSADVASDVKTLTDSIAAKADAKTVNDAISKIDFTPYAKSADVDSKLKGYTDTADLTKLLAGKADSDFSYSKAELDKKFLELSTDTGGKVDANQVATMIENKADKSDVTKQIGTVTDLVNTKANSTDVTAALDKKDDITDVDAKIKTVTDLANTKANVGDVYNISAIDTAFSQRDSKITNLQNSALQVIEGHADDDILSFRDDKVRVYNNCQNVKNLPPMGNEIWFYTVTRISHGWGSVTVISQDNCYWQNVLNGDTWAGWTKHATSADIDNLTNQINQKANSSDVDSKIKTVTDLANAKANSSDVYTKSQVDSKTSGTIITHFDVANMTPTKESNSYNARWLVDQLALADLASQINQLKGRRTVDQADFNSLTDSGVYYVSSPKTNNPVQQWGTLVVSNGNSNRLSQLYYPDDNSAPWYRTLNGSTWKSWVQLATASQVSDAKNTATQANNGLASKANSSDVTALQSKVNVNSSLYRMIGDNDTWLKIFGVNNNDTPVLTSLRLQGGTGPLLGNYAAGVGFGGADTKGVLSVAYAYHQARITGGNGDDPVWSEDIAWKSDISSLTQALAKLQAAFDAQQTKIAALQTTVNNQANQLTYFKQHYIEGKAFDADQIKQAMAWTGDDSQKLAILRDKENEGGK